MLWAGLQRLCLIAVWLRLEVAAICPAHQIPRFPFHVVCELHFCFSLSSPKLTLDLKLAGNYGKKLFEKNRFYWFVEWMVKVNLLWVFQVNCSKSIHFSHHENRFFPLALLFLSLSRNASAVIWQNDFMRDEGYDFIWYRYPISHMRRNV